MTNLTDDFDLQCSACGEGVGSENINYAIKVAKCSHCDSVFRFDKPSAIQSDVSSNESQGLFDKIFQSQQFIHWTLLVFMVFWNISFLIFILTCVNKGYTALAVMLGVVTAIGLYLTYFLVAALFGSKQACSEDTLSSSWRTALPFFGGHQEVIDNLNIRSVFAERYQLVRTQNHETVAYKLKGINQNGDKVELVKGLRHEEQAIEMEAEIRNFIRPRFHNKTSV